MKLQISDQGHPHKAYTKVSLALPKGMVEGLGMEGGSKVYMRRVPGGLAVSRVRMNADDIPVCLTVRKTAKRGVLYTGYAVVIPARLAAGLALRAGLEARMALSHGGILARLPG